MDPIFISCAIASAVETIDSLEGAFAAPQLAAAHKRRVVVLLHEATGGKIEKDALVITHPERKEVLMIFELGKKIRDSRYGGVWQSVRLLPYGETSFYKRDLSQIVAIKVSNKAELVPTEDNPIAEISAFQAMLPHGSILRLLIAAESKTYLYMITEYCDGGELLDFVNENGALDESLARCYFTQIVSGMKHIRNAGIVHRDLSPENILLSNGRSECKIMDLGLALKMHIRHEDGILLPFSLPQGIVGKQRFLSPETLAQSRPFYAHQVDIWSLGIILFVLLTGDVPFEAALPTFKAYRMIREGQLSTMLLDWRLQRGDRPIPMPALSADAIDLMQSILRENPLERLSIEEIEGHRWMHAAVHK